MINNIFSAIYKYCKSQNFPFFYQRIHGKKYPFPLEKLLEKDIVYGKNKKSAIKQGEIL